MARPTRCARCGRDNDPVLVSCLDCGVPLRSAAPSPPSAPALAAPPSLPPPVPALAAAPPCPGCGAPLPAAFRFCSGCGTPAGAPPVARTPASRAGSPAAPAAPPTPPLPTRGRLRLAAPRSDGLPGPVHALEDGEAVCGRTEGAIRIAGDPTVSPRHARFTSRGGALAVEDLGSLNGTFVRLRKPRRIGPGDELRIGRQRLRVEPVARPAPGAGEQAWGAPDPGCRIRLVQLLDGGGVGEVFPLRQGASAVGRESGDAAFPGDRYVSARHARLDVDGEAVTVTDLGSSNGTFVRISGPTALGPGDQLLVGAQLLRVEA